MLLYEFRVVLPISLEELKIAQLYSVAEMSKNETGGGDGVEIAIDEPRSCRADDKLTCGGVTYDNAQYTYKILHLCGKLPSFFRTLSPSGSTELHEAAWNAFPYCKTDLRNHYMKENFQLLIETIHLADHGNTENAHQLSQEDLAQRVVIPIDIAENNRVMQEDIALADPSTFCSEKTGRGPLKPGWQDNQNPVVCAYKLVRLNCRWFGLQDKIERTIINAECRIFQNFYRQLFCWMDKWHGLTLEDIRTLEEKTKDDLNEARDTGAVRGMIFK